MTWLLFLFYCILFFSFPAIHFEKFWIYRKVARRVHWISVHPSPRRSTCLVFVYCLTVLWHFLSLSVMYLFSLNLLRVSCRHHYMSPLVIQQVSAKNKNILLHNHSKEHADTVLSCSMPSTAHISPVIPVISMIGVFIFSRIPVKNHKC